MLPKPDARTGVIGLSSSVRSRESQPLPTALRISRTCGLDADPRRVVGIFSRRIFAAFPRVVLGPVVLSDYCDSPLGPAKWPPCTGVGRGWTACRSMITDTQPRTDKAIELDESHAGY